MIDFRLPCGSGLDILIDPSPGHAACRAALQQLELREETALDLPEEAHAHLARRRLIPALRLLLFGEGPELRALAALAAAVGLEVESHDKSSPGMAMGRAPELPPPDRWTAVVLLFHDHEWEQAIIEWALASPAFFIGAQGGKVSREERVERLQGKGCSAAEIARITSPIGVVGHSREPAPLAMSALAQVMSEYEALHPHHRSRD